MAESHEKVRRFVFMAHYIEPWNILLKWFPFLHKEPRWRLLFLLFYPFCWLLSVYYGLGSRAFDVVDHYSVNGRMEGYTILIRNFAWQFILPGWHERIRLRILEAAFYAQNKLNADTIGLGALIKAEWLTEGGAWLARQPGINVPITHGDTMTAWFVVRQIEAWCRRNGMGRDKPIMVTGATSKIGRAVVLWLAERGYSFLLYSRSEERAQAIIGEASFKAQPRLRWSKSLLDGQDCRLWLIGKAEPIGWVLARHVPQGAAVINFSVPDPFSTLALWWRRDLRHYDGGLVRLPPSCRMRFMMRLRQGITYSCAAGAMTHAWLGWLEHEVGAVSVKKMEEVGREALKLGFELPPPTSLLRPVGK